MILKGIAIKNNKTFIPTLSDSAGIDSYIRFVNNIQILTESEEKKFSRKFKYSEDLEAAQKLIVSHLRFVVKIARGFSGYGLSITDLVQEGNIGLMKAVKRFNPEMGVRLVSFAVHWIKAEMHEYIIKNWRIVKVATTKSQRKLFFNLRSSKKKSGWLKDSELKEVAFKLDVRQEVVSEMEKRMNSCDISLELSSSDQDNSDNNTILCLKDHNSNPEITVENDEFETKNRQKLKLALSNLDSRSYDIIVSRWFSCKKITLRILARRYNISAERVRQLEDNAIQKLRLLVKSY